LRRGEPELDALGSPKKVSKLRPRTPVFLAFPAVVILYSCSIYSEGSSFDINRFYADILPVDEDEDIGDKVQMQKAAGDFEELFEVLRRKASKKRRLGVVPFVVTEGAAGLQFNVQYYCTLKPATKPSGVWLEAKSNTQLKVRQTMLP
jgi:hypothetical protein